MSIGPINKSFAPIQPVTDLQKGGGINGVTPQDKEHGFAGALKDALNEVDGMQKSADKQIEGLMTGKSDVTMHDAMIALQKADVAFQLMTAIRTKIVRAYEEVMRTQV